MLPKKNRISRVLFDTVLKDGAFFHSQNLSFRVVKAQKRLSKFSFVVSKKVSKSAVVRNLLRRRGYSVLKSIIGTKSKEKMDNAILGAFFFKKGAEKLGFDEVRGEIEFLLKKARVL
jgi:ribonuclease P protein component